MDDDWRGIQWYDLPGHLMYRMSQEEMGGGCSGISIGCETCDPEHHLKTYEFWNWPGIEHVYTVNEALLQSRKDMWKHAHPERQKS